MDLQRLVGQAKTVADCVIGHFSRNNDGLTAHQIQEACPLIRNVSAVLSNLELEHNVLVRCGTASSHVTGQNIAVYVPQNGDNRAISQHRAKEVRVAAKIIRDFTYSPQQALAYIEAKNCSIADFERDLEIV